MIIQSFTGFVNMAYSPLFQVYVMGRNLERPFKNPNAKKLEDLAGAAATSEVGVEEQASVEVSAEKHVTSTAIEAIEDSSDDEDAAENEESVEAKVEDDEEEDDEEESDEDEDDSEEESDEDEE